MLRYGDIKCLLVLPQMKLFWPERRHDDLCGESCLGSFRREYYWRMGADPGSFAPISSQQKAPSGLLSQARTLPLNLSWTTQWSCASRANLPRKETQQ